LVAFVARVGVAAVPAQPSQALAPRPVRSYLEPERSLYDREFFFQPIEVAGLLEQQARQILSLFKYHIGFCLSAGRFVTAGGGAQAQLHLPPVLFSRIKVTSGSPNVGRCCGRSVGMRIGQRPLMKPLLTPAEWTALRSRL
jgi:hypothetical protein